MRELLSGPGFLGTNAPFVSDLCLVVILVTAVLFTYGRHLARRKRYTAHRWIQTGAVALSTLVAMTFMLNSFVRHILPGVPSKLLEGDYGISTLHALVGAAAVLLGVFVVMPWLVRTMVEKRFRGFCFVVVREQEGGDRGARR